MKLRFTNRSIHYWISIFAALPLLVITVTGLLLHMKKKVDWIQPPERKGSGGEHSLSLPRILEISKQVPEARIETWEDIRRLDMRPDKSLVKVTARNNWEIQIDTQSGAVLQTAYRRSDLIESLHDGSWFHDAVKWWVFFPAGGLLLLLWGTGLYLFLSPYWRRVRRL